ncbi:MAG: hypothetical protein V9H69_04780 [Anaerolineae bacterium]|jgi:hypothetical protein
MGVKDIEAAITQLPLKDVAQLANWLTDYQAELWDRQIEEDLAAGRLDALLAEVEREHAAGLTQPL